MSLYSRAKNFIKTSLPRHSIGQGIIRYRNRKVLRRRYKILSKQGGVNFPFPPFNIPSLLKKNPDKGLGLVFFMGMGDYLQITPVLANLRKKYPDRFIRAYAGRFNDNNNSGLNYQLMKLNPNFDEVVRFDGYPRPEWWFYDTSLAHFHNENSAEKCVLLPVLYEHPMYKHRTIAQAKMFGVSRKIENPIIYPCAESREKAEKFANEYGGFKDRQIILLHCDARSSGFVGYEMKIRLAGMLRTEFKDAVILTVGEVGSPSYIRESLTKKQYPFWSSPMLDSNEKFMGDPASGGGIIPLDINAMSILDSIEIVRLAQECTKMTAICVNSVFWYITAGLGTPMLGLHLYSEYAAIDYWYGNNRLLTSQYIKQIPKNKQCINIKFPRASEGEMTPDYNEVQVFVEYRKMLNAYEAYQKY